VIYPVRRESADPSTEFTLSEVEGLGMTEVQIPRLRSG
jgi:hypothetical protein